MSRTAEATVYGAVSIVNAIGTGMGATLGTSLATTVRVSARPGRGIFAGSSHMSRVTVMTAQNAIPPEMLKRHRVEITVASQVPTGCGLKSSSATTTAVAMACTTLFYPDMDESSMLSCGVDASIRSGVSMTGAFDDVCGCYYGGFNVTQNDRRLRVRHDLAPQNMVAVIFVPTNRRRRNVRNLKKMRRSLARAWAMARDGRYWDAMLLNGLTVSPVLGPDPFLLDSLLDAGALSASLSGNGPSVAAIARAGGERDIQRILAPLDGRVTVSPLSNKKARVHEL